MPKPLSRRLLACAGLILAGLHPLYGGTQATFYVSNAGDDAHDGTTALGAFATVARARDAVRASNAHMSGDIVVEIARGDYTLKETLVFTERDSGTNGFRVIFKNQDAIGSARLLGGSRVTGWVAGRGTTYQARIGAGLPFNTLYENGIRADLARWPKRTSPFASSRGGYMVLTGDAGGGHSFADYAPSPDGLPFHPAGEDFGHAWIYSWNGDDGHRWCSSTVPVKSMSGGLIMANGLGSAPTSFLIEGVPGLLSRPGEFFYDQASGILSYCSRFPGRIENQEIVASALTRLVGVVGTSAEAPAHDLTFAGLTIAATDAMEPSGLNDWSDGQPSSSEGAVYLKNARNVRFENCRIADTGVNGVTLGADTAACELRGCLIEHTGYHGVNLNGGAHNTVADCLIRYCGELRGHGSGISLMDGTHVLSHLDIYYTARAGVAIRGKGDVVEYVKVHDCVQDSGDQGAFYLVDPAANATFNQCTSLHNYVDLSCMDRPPTAVYNDRGAPDTVWSNIDCGDSQMYIFRHDPQPAGSAMIFDNVNWSLNFKATDNQSTDKANPAFDRNKMEYGKIGLTPAFPAVYNDLKSRPAAPLNLWAESGDGQLTLHWTQSDRATAYTIRRAAPGGAYAGVGSVTVPVTGPDPGTSYLDQRAPNGAANWYIVSASNATGEGPPSLPLRAMASPNGSNRLTGKAIGVGSNAALATDGNLRTYYQDPNGWAGLDLGMPEVITGIRYSPRSDNTDTTAQMCGGEFQGAADPGFNTPTTFFKVLATKGGAGTPVLIPQSIYGAPPCRYVRYIGPGGKSLLAEMEFYGHPPLGGGFQR